MPDLSRTLRTAFTRVLNRRTAVRRGQLGVTVIAQRQVTLYLPPGYSDRGERRYPVLYMQDGQNLFDDARAFAGRSWRLRDAADEAIGARTASPMIIVGVDHAGNDRVHEYTPTYDALRKVGGKADEYGHFLFDQVKRAIDDTYLTLPQSTFVGGSSLGALVSLHLALKYPEVVRGAMVMSPSVWWDDRAILAEVDAYGGRASARPTFWLDIGGREGREALEGVHALRDRLRAKGWNDATLRTFEDRRADHSERAWGARVRKALEFLFPPE
jgi:predicted alpha/beta superfamily hydrolase